MKKLIVGLVLIVLGITALIITLAVPWYDELHPDLAEFDLENLLVSDDFIFLGKEVVRISIDLKDADMVQIYINDFSKEIVKGWEEKGLLDYVIERGLSKKELTRIKTKPSKSNKRSYAQLPKDITRLKKDLLGFYANGIVVDITAIHDTDKVLKRTIITSNPLNNLSLYTSNKGNDLIIDNSVNRIVDANIWFYYGEHHFMKGKTARYNVDAKSGTNNFIGGTNNDTFYGGKGQDIIFGGEGDDIMYANEGDDKLYGDYGEDELHGSYGNDFLYGDYGKDKLYGDWGDDTIFVGPSASIPGQVDDVYDDLGNNTIHTLY